MAVGFVNSSTGCAAPHQTRGTRIITLLHLARYRRFRRPADDGLTLLGAFWGENRRCLDVGIGRFCLGRERPGARRPHTRRTWFGQDAGDHPSCYRLPDAAQDIH